MKPILAALLCASALGAAGAPVLAQPARAVTPATVPGRDFREQLQTLQDRLDAGVRDRTIDRIEFDRATRELTRIRDDIRTRWSDGRMDERDRMELQRRIDDLARSIHWARVNDRPPVVAGVPAGDFRSQLQTLQDRLDAGVRERTIDRIEFDRATRELTRIRDDMRARWSDGRMDERDRMEVQHRIDDLARSIHWARETGRPPIPGPGPGGFSLQQREDWLQQRIERGRADGTLDRRTAWQATRMLSDIRRDEARLMRRDRGVLTPRDRQFVESRLDRLRDMVRSARDADRAPW